MREKRLESYELINRIAKVYRMGTMRAKVEYRNSATKNHFNRLPNINWSYCGHLNAFAPPMCSWLSTPTPTSCKQSSVMTSFWSEDHLFELESLEGKKTSCKHHHLASSIIECGLSTSAAKRFLWHGIVNGLWIRRADLKRAFDDDVFT
jgi:hypothetical protein